MKAAILEAPYQIAIREIEDLKPGLNDILIKTEVAGVCGSDLHAFKGRHPFRKPPVILGHEVAGTVVKTGASVKHLQEGDRVTVMPLLACEQCDACRRGSPQICLNKKVPGPGDWPGFFAEYALSDASIAYKIGEHTRFAESVLAEPLAVGIHSVRRAGVMKGAKVLVLGAGTIGILTAAAAASAGAGEIAVTDLFASNLSTAASLCGAIPYDAADKNLIEEISRRQGKFDFVFLCSGAQTTVQQALQLVRPGGKIVVVGMFLDAVPLDLLAVTLREIEIVGSVVYTHDDFQKALKWIDSGDTAFGRLITHTFPLEKAQEALNQLLEHQDHPLKILLKNL
jgi:L-iditol 2-dehydrogenase